MRNWLKKWSWTIRRKSRLLRTTMKIETEKQPKKFSWWLLLSKSWRINMSWKSKRWQISLRLRRSIWNRFKPKKLLNWEPIKQMLLKQEKGKCIRKSKSHISQYWQRKRKSLNSNYSTFLKIWKQSIRLPLQKWKRTINKNSVKNIKLTRIWRLK